MEGLCISVDLGIGITLALFHKFGNFPEVIDLNSLAIDGAIDLAVSFSIRDEMLSDPFAL